jgi:uncharacterized membrane protein SpoIIM required for sporulation
MTLSTERFFRERRADWDRLAQLLERKQALEAQEVAEIGRLYRAVTTDLAIARRDFPHTDLTRFLNQLTARAHATLYRTNPWTTRQARHFFRATLPRAFRAAWPFILVASLLLWLPAFVTGALALSHPDAVTRLLEDDVGTVVQRIADHDPWFWFDKKDYPVASANIMTNNIRVSVLAYAGGMTAGLLTIYVLLLNGVLLGGLLGLAWHHQFYDLWYFVVAHGVVELFVIGVAGGAGLQFAWAMLRPAPWSRRDALMLAGQRALLLLIIVTLALVVAGVIEGFISPRPELHPAIKTVVGFGSWGVMMGWLMGGGRGERQREAERDRERQRQRQREAGV